MNEGSEEHTGSSEEEAFDFEAFGKALNLLSEKETVEKISETAKRISGNDISLCVLKEKKRPEDHPKLYFVVNTDDIAAGYIGELSAQIQITLGCEALSVVLKKWGDYRQLTEVSIKNLENIKSFLAEHYKNYQINPRSPLTQSREQHGIFDRSPVLESPPRTGKEEKQSSPEGTTPRTEEMQTSQIKKLGSPGATKK